VDSVVRIERVIDLPRPIVGDALVDPVLVEGWLHPVLRLEDFAEVRVSATEVAGGTRGGSTRVTVEIAAPDPRFGIAMRETWEARLDQLEDLLRGHPVDWRVGATDETGESIDPARDTRAN
jgi:uncharacterized protein YndB with AHSA1/START domain